MPNSRNISVETRGVGKEYRLQGNRIHALKNVSLAMEQGEFVAIMGPSGSGKSTLLNLLGGLDTPTQGAVYLEGTELSTMNEKALAAFRRKKLGFVFQRHDLFPALTVRQNIEFPLILHDVPQRDRENRVNSLLALVGLEDKGGNLPEELSGGQQQRVGIARALANEPAILLADEPTGNLDSKTSAEIMDFLTDLCKKSGETLVLVTHDPEVARRADRTIFLRDGELVSQEGVLL